MATTPISNQELYKKQRSAQAAGGSGTAANTSYTPGGNNTPVAAMVKPQNGETYTGWVINGQTFKDAGGTQRIDSGSTVELADGRQYVYNTATGGVPTAATARNEYTKKDYLSGYDDALRYTQQGIDTLADAQKAAYNRQADWIRKDAAQAKKEAQEAYIKASDPYGPIGQRLEAMGLGNSGYAESTYANLGNQYQKLLAEQNMATERSLAQLYGDIETAYAQAEAEKAQAMANMIMQKAAAEQNNAQYLANFDLNNAQYANQLNQYDEQRQYQQGRDAIEDARYAQEWQAQQDEIAYNRKNDAIAYVMSGYITPEIAAAAGMTEAEAWALYNRMNPPKVSSGSSGGSGFSENADGAVTLGGKQVDTTSILGLGKGPLSAAGIAQLIDAGEADIIEGLDGSVKVIKPSSSKGSYRNPFGSYIGTAPKMPWMLK